MASKFKKEFKNQLRLAIAAAIGFIIAFSWRDFVIKLVGDTYSVLQTAMPITSKFLTAITITLIGVFLIIITSKLLK